MKENKETTIDDSAMMVQKGFQSMEEEVKDFVIKHILSSLRLTESQREYLKPNS